MHGAYVKYKCDFLWFHVTIWYGSSHRVTLHSYTCNNNIYTLQVYKLCMNTSMFGWKQLQNIWKGNELENSFPEELQPNASHGLFIHEVSRSHTTNHGRYDSSGPMISPSQRPLPDNTQHSQQISMPLVGFEPTIPANERPQTYALDRAASGISELMNTTD